jgi:hypothetical protein
MRLLIRLAPRAYFTSYISQISVKSARNSVLPIVRYRNKLCEKNWNIFKFTSLKKIEKYPQICMSITWKLGKLGYLPILHSDADSRWTVWSSPSSTWCLHPWKETRLRTRKDTWELPFVIQSIKATDISYCSLENGIKSRTTRTLDTHTHFDTIAIIK